MWWNTRSQVVSLQEPQTKMEDGFHGHIFHQAPFRFVQESPWQGWLPLVHPFLRCHWHAAYQRRLPTWQQCRYIAFYWSNKASWNGKGQKLWIFKWFWRGSRTCFNSWNRCKKWLRLILFTDSMFLVQTTSGGTTFKTIIYLFIFFFFYPLKKIRNTFKKN